MIQTIGVIGAGQMGIGIAQVCATAGYDVIIHDIETMRLVQGIAFIDSSLDRQIAKGKISESEKPLILKRLSTIHTLKEIGPCDLVIEAATETLDLKIQILQAVCPYLAPKTLLVSNTSSLSITRLGAATDRPDCFMGMHFMNPVPVMVLVELIRGLATTTETFESIKEVVQRLAKVGAVSKDSPGFIVNRILIPMINEAIWVLYEGVGTAEDIDKCMTLGTNQPMGPLALADLIGLDTCLAIMRTLHQELGDDKYRPCPLLTKYVEAGWLGRKSQRGFYTNS